MTAALPDWTGALPPHLRLDEAAGHPLVRYVHTGGVFWDSGCATCRGRTAVVQIMPNHQASPSCRSGGRNHCTCDACF
ncbi:hypothetical protein H7J07_06080 [Mycobacterium koreense]|uniref:Uncharacterized protein n=1 Tax=Mycolicibacillus koreensis TaxID=1069220 RepID=A0A7I7SBB8_9MYCO|nr:hypothetical protein [Mycolicibacillus koreensis]MCV7247795.1 hypothetical protein [Mycolicibacillus koreensis]OSC34689.1 hypothetical protein B8W67_05425 [Mycolicibacillus koreensis]BBY54182.1 hypothetical protein MKOR_14330 [Mycolicibacillus koreensis]